VIGGHAVHAGARETRAAEDVAAADDDRDLHAVLVANGDVMPGGTVRVDLTESGESLTLVADAATAEPTPTIETVLAVDDNADLLGWMERVLGARGWRVLAASTAAEAAVAFREGEPDAVVIDYVLPDNDGVSLARALIGESPGVKVVMMSGMDLEEEDALLCRVHGIPFLVKPFLADELLAALESRGTSPGAARATGA
jgi:CheY-like chemotaxis protein